MHGRLSERVLWWISLYFGLYRPREFAELTFTSDPYIQERDGQKSEMNKSRLISKGENSQIDREIMNSDGKDLIFRLKNCSTSKQ